MKGENVYFLIAIIYYMQDTGYNCVHSTLYRSGAVVQYANYIILFMFTT